MSARVFEGTERFPFSVHDVWKVLADLRKLSSCFPGFRDISGEGTNDARITIWVKVGRISKAMSLRTKLLETSEPSKAKFKASGDDIEVQGEITLKPLDDTTDLSYKLTVRAQSTLARLAMGMLSGDYINEQTSIFIGNLKRAVSPT